MREMIAGGFGRISGAAALGCWRLGAADGGVDRGRDYLNRECLCVSVCGGCCSGTGLLALRRERKHTDFCTVRKLKRIFGVFLPFFKLDARGFGRYAAAQVSKLALDFTLVGGLIAFEAAQVSRKSKI
jgi:hypothetical protein